MNLRCKPKTGELEGCQCLSHCATATGKQPVGPNHGKKPIFAKNPCLKGICVDFSEGIPRRKGGTKNESPPLRSLKTGHAHLGW